ncbi:ClpXP protease specificity-enhancing factor SspB [Tardiphaga sp. 709]|uniref:ClpXP protease specificity-enhancing factor SspB n=1 Tax=Tardiphaga sp. 709 TaxID=3076039 RepID=UPI0028E4E582|nr:ClpXP protease specificity-enhancing factor SspB [Tardiphaga sp. 709]WNV10320.1 ClpXP protease specificity-enhancing factor SspB [Tardiphaga sp. 709]
MTPSLPRDLRTLAALFAAAMTMLAALAPHAAAQQPCTTDPLAQYAEVRSTLADVARRGLRGRHYYEITFRTSFNGVIVPDAQRAQYPEDMTFVLQHQFERLNVTADRFSVNLWFKGIMSRVTVPFNAVTYFVDPSVNKRRTFDPGTNARVCDKP